jgi:hypothetical protein
MVARKVEVSTIKRSSRRRTKNSFLPTSWTTKQLQVLAGIAVASLLAVGLFLTRTERIAMSFTVVAPNGGVVMNPGECTPLPEYESEFGPIKVVSDLDVDVVLPEVFWSVNSTNDCLGTFYLNLSPSSEYRVSVGNIAVGAIGSENFSSKKFEYSRTITVTRDLRGLQALVDIADYCVGESCYWYDRRDMNFTASGTDKSCSGAGRFQDLRNGTEVTVFNSKGDNLGSTVLRASMYVVDTSTQKVTCFFIWNLDNVPNDDDGYSVQVSSRGKVDFSREQAVENDYLLATQVGP